MGAGPWGHASRNICLSTTPPFAFPFASALGVPGDDHQIIARDGRQKGKMFATRGRILMHSIARPLSFPRALMDSLTVHACLVPMQCIAWFAVRCALCGASVPPGKKV